MPSKANSNPKCLPGECIAGSIGESEIKVRDWATEHLRFQGKIDLWNELTKHFAIPHIGFAQAFRHCHQCGHEIDLVEAKGDRGVLNHLVEWADKLHPSLQELDVIVAQARERVKVQ